MPGPKSRPITAKDTLNGQLITFSFHVEEENKIKCYILWNGQTMRFRGENIANILSYLFVDSVPNVKDKKYESALKKFDAKIQDIDFDEFYRKINTGYEKISLKG